MPWFVQATEGAVSIGDSRAVVRCVVTSIILRSTRFGPRRAVASSMVGGLLVFGALALEPSRSAAAAPVVANADDTVLDSGTASTLDSARAVDVAVRKGADDAEERVRTGWVSLTSWDLELGVNGPEAQLVGLRFRSVAVPADARIVSAYVQFQVDEVSTDSAALTVEGFDSNSAAPFRAMRRDISSRSRTAASVAWTPPEWPKQKEEGADQRTPDLSEVVQEIVDRAGWETGNALGLVITGEGRRTARSFETGPPAVLHVEYES
jgi:hypothetical protein